jgi:leukotriene-A4 hydrolase
MMVPVLLLAAAAATPVARDVHSFGNPDEVRPTHLALDLTLDFTAKTMTGTADLTLAYPGKAPVKELRLDTRDLTIRSVTGDDGKPLTFTLGAKTPHLGQPLQIALPTAAPKRVRISYATSPEASALQWLEPRQTTSGALPFLLTQSQAIHARSWIPIMDSPGVRVTYEAVVRVPKGITAVMSAEHLTHDPAQGMFRFKMPQAIPAYLIALAAGELAFRPLSERTGVYAEPAVVEKAAAEFADVEKMVQATEALYGPYAWGRWDTIVLPPSFPFGGMENPRLTFATPTIIAGDRSLVNVMVHELAHSWSGNLVTNATWSDFWLNEGFTTYIENRVTEALYGREVAEMLQLLGQRDLRQEVIDVEKAHAGDSKLYLALEGRDPDEGMTEVAYEKGANFLRVLEKQFGRPALDAFLRSYFEAHKFQSMTTAQFLERLKRELFKGDEALWKTLRVEEWVHQPGIPTNIVVPSSARAEATRAAAAEFTKTGSLTGVRKDWVTVEWLEFLNSLEKPLSAERLRALDEAFAFSRSGNSEILFAWLMHGVRSSWEPAYPALESFLTRQGRRKFLKPLYEAMMANPSTQDMARRIYAKARPGYHPISTATIDKIVK